MLEDHGHDLLANGNNRVQAGHGVLEHGGDAAAADLLPVVGILHVGAVDDGVAFQLVFSLVQLAEFHVQRAGLDDAAAHFLAVQVFSLDHGLADQLVQPVEIIDLVLDGIPAHGQEHVV